MPAHDSVQIFEVMHRLLRVYYRQHQEPSAHLGLTRNEMRMILFLGRRPGASQSEMVTESGSDKGLIARQVAVLLERGLITKESALPARRGASCFLSIEGRRVYDELQTIAEGVARKFLTPIDGETRKVLANGLNKILDASH